MRGGILKQIFIIIDNSDNSNKKVHEWISNYTKTGKISIVTGYFTIGALCYLSRETNHKINEYKFILGDIAVFVIVPFQPFRNAAEWLRSGNGISTNREIKSEVF
jgi:hypothetical protein